MQLKDCIHFYLGCECVNSWFPPDHEGYNKGYNKGWKLTGIDTSSLNPYKLETDNDYTWTDSVKLILKKWKLSKDITTEAARLGPAAYFHAMPYLCAEGFDLFDLIESGEALDAETIKQS